MTPCRFFAYPSRDGLALLGRDYGSAAAPGLPLVCLPGLTRSSRDFTALAEYLAGRAERPRRVIALDFRGRGGSAHGAVATYNPATEADDVGLALAAQGIPRAHFLGTSRGGLVMMVLALTRPGLMAATILNDIGPVIDPAGLARIAGYVGVAPPATWPEATAALKASQSFAFPDLDDAGWERFTRQIHRDDGGRPRLDYDPALAEAFKAFDPAKPLPDLWPSFAAIAASPMMVVHGARSDILSEATVAEMLGRHGGLVVRTVADEGHAPLLWDAATQAGIAAFLDAADEAVGTVPLSA